MRAKPVRPGRTSITWAAAAATAAITLPGPAVAQTVLPGITVTTPSPVTRNTPPRSGGGTAQAGAPSAAAPAPAQSGAQPAAGVQTCPLSSGTIVV